MSIRKPLIFFMLVFAIVALFAASEVMAFCDYCNPDPPDLPISVTAGGYTITLELIEEVTAGCTPYDPETSLPLPPTASPCHRWTYNVHNEGAPGTLNGLNFLALFIPDCKCTDPYVYFDLSTGVPDNAKIYPVGVGEPTVNLGRFNQSTYIFKVTPNSYLMSFVTTTNVVTTIPMALATGKKDDMTSFEGPGPGCTHPEIPPCVPKNAGASTFYECVNWYGDPSNAQDDVSFEVTRRGDREGCIESLLACVGTGCETGCVPITREDLPEDYVSSGALRPGTCPDEVVNVKTGSPYYLYQVVSGGYVFRGCLDLGDYQWEPTLDCCLDSTYPGCYP